MHRVRLEVCTLGPFVPGVNEYQSLVRIRVSPSSKHRAMQPLTVNLRIGMDPDCTLVPHPRSIVPTRHHSWEKGEVVSRMGNKVFGDFAVIVDFSAKIVGNRKLRIITLH